MNDKRPNIVKTFYVKPIEVGLTVKFNHIYYDFGKATLSDQSFSELHQVASFFQANPRTVFEIAGHTDGNGPADYNLALSQARAQAVVDYLTHHGVAQSQLVAKGYGSSEPIDTRKTREADSKNRRVEFRVISMGR